MTSGDLAARLRVMAITDPACPGGMLETARKALAAGVPALQLRWKEATGRDLLQAARALRRVTAEAGALLVVNDRLDVAMLAGADGAHLGDDDLPLRAARDIVPPGFLLGRSVDDAAEAATAEAEGADYVGLGPVFVTESKAGLGGPIGAEGVVRVRAATGLPLVAIGGIDEARARAVVGAGADGVAVIAAIMRASDPEGAARRLLSEVDTGIRERRTG